MKRLRKYLTIKVTVRTPTKENNQCGLSHQNASLVGKGSHQTVKISEEDAKPKSDNKNYINPTCPFYLHEHDMNSCKVIQEHGKSMMDTWLSACGGGGHVKFAGANKRLSNGKYLNTLVALDAAKAMNTTKTVK